MTQNVLIEVASAHGCSKCLKAKETVERMVSGMKSVVVKEVNIAENPEFAIKHGIFATPAVIINGKLQFTSIPNENDLKKYLKEIEGEIK